MSKEKVIQIDIEKLKMLFNDMYSYYRGTGAVTRNLSDVKKHIDKNEWYGVFESITKAEEEVNDLDDKIKSLRDFLISSGCILD